MQPFEADVQIERTRRGVFAGYMAVMLLIMANAAAQAFHWWVVSPTANLLLPWINLAAVATLFLPRRFWRERVPARVRADDAGLHVDGRLVIARDRLRRGLVTGAARSDVAVSGGVLRAARVGCRTHDEAQALLDALGLGVSGAVYWFPARTSASRHLPVALGLTMAVLGVAAGMAVTLRSGTAAVAALLVGLPAVLAFLLVMSRRVHQPVRVGADGLLVGRGKRARFVPYDRVASVSVERPDIVLGLRGEPPLRLGLPDARAGGPREQAAESREAIARRIEEARAASVRADVRPAVEALVAPGARRPDEWVRAMRQLTTSHEYRVPALDADALWRVAEDPACAAASRAGAALALAPSLDAEGRLRLRAAAAACAEPRLRVALDKLAEEDGDPGEVDAIVQRLA